MPVLGATALLGILVAGAAAHDWRLRRIPNWLNLLIALAGFALAFVAGGLPQLADHGLHFLIATIIGLLLFRLRIVGGGDAKFYMAVTAWFPVEEAIVLGVTITFAGVLLVIAYFVAGRIVQRTISKQDAKKGLPYGIAIAAGAILSRLAF